MIDAASVVAARSEALRALTDKGGMVSILTTRDEAERLVECYRETVSIAAMNGPRSVVLSGENEALDELSGVNRRESRRSESRLIMRRIPRK